MPVFQPDRGPWVFVPQKSLWDPILWVQGLQRHFFTKCQCHYNTKGLSFGLGGTLFKDSVGPKITIFWLKTCMQVTISKTCLFFQPCLEIQDNKSSQFLSFVVKGTYPAMLGLWLLISWWNKEPRHQQAWYWPHLNGIFCGTFGRVNMDTAVQKCIWKCLLHNDGHFALFSACYLLPAEL